MIPSLNKQQIENEINSIIQKADIKQQHFLRQFFQLIKTLGWRQVILTRHEWLFTLIVMGIISLLLIYPFDFEGTVEIFQYSLFLFMLAPLLFAVLLYVLLIDKEQYGMFEIEMTMKYTFFHFITQRMIIYSAMTIFITTFIGFLLTNLLQISFLNLLLITSSSLFLFAIGLLAVIHSGPIIIRFTIYISVWLFTFSVLLIFPNSYLTLYIMQIPQFIFILITIVLFIGFYFSMKNFYLSNKEEVLLC